MNDPVWQLDPAHYRARLQYGPLSLQIALDHPQAGWQDLRQDDQSLPFAPAQTWFPGTVGSSASPPASMHIRGTDLVAVYPATPERQFTAEIYRGVSPLQLGPQSLVVMSTLISLHTQLLDAQPKLTVVTDHAAPDEMWIATDGDFNAAVAGDEPPADSSAVLLRPEQANSLSYLELWHPIDYQNLQLEAARWVHSFAEPLEKGVIRRLLVWGVLLPRADDLALAAAVREEFAQTAVPLTT